MKVNLGLEIDDARRNVLAQLLDGKPNKRLATRDEVRAFVEQLIESLATVQPAPPRVGTQDFSSTESLDHGDLAAVANARVAEMRAGGSTEEYIQSWLRGFWKKGKKEER